MKKPNSPVQNITLREVLRNSQFAVSSFLSAITQNSKSPHVPCLPGAFHGPPFLAKGDTRGLPGPSHGRPFDGPPFHGSLVL